MYIRPVEELGKERRQQEPKKMVEVNTNHVYGGQFGRKVMVDVLKKDPIPFTRSNGIV